MPKLQWTLSAFKDLSTIQLFDMYQLRQAVFVVEQDCPYQDCDQKDKKSHHLFAYDKEVLVAYLRIVSPGVSYKEPSIGRVLTKLSYRKNGYGIELMERGIEFCNSYYTGKSIRISAQQYLLPFYRSLGFRALGDVYLEDNIPHMEMLYTQKK